MVLQSTVNVTVAVAVTPPKLQRAVTVYCPVRSAVVGPFRLTLGAVRVHTGGGALTVYVALALGHPVRGAS